MSLLDCLREKLLLTGTRAGCEHGICGTCTVLLDGEPVRSCLMLAVQADGYAITTIESVAPGPGELSVIQDAFCEMHGMQCGYCTAGMVLTAQALLAANPAPTERRSSRRFRGNLCRCTGYGQIIEAIELAAERLRLSNAAALERDAMTVQLPGPFRYVGKKRRVREDRRFVAGAGRYAADLALPGMLHAVPVQSDRPCARIVRIDAEAALAMPGVRAVVTGAQLAAAIDPLMAGAHAPKVHRYPMAVGRARYVGEWVAVVVADSRAPGRGRARACARSNTKTCPTCWTPRRRCVPTRRRCIRNTAPTSCSTSTSSGGRSRRISPRRNTACPITCPGAATPPCRWRPSRVAARWDHGTRDARRLGLDPDAEIPRPDRPRAAPAGQRRARALRRRCRRQLRRQARHQARGAGRATWRACWTRRCGWSRTGWRT